jgi:hypothetical protein
MDTFDIRLIGGLAIAAVALLCALLYRLRQNAAHRWPSAEATAGSTGVGQASGESGPVWYVRVNYSFTVNGDYFGGTTDRIVGSAEAGAELARKVIGKRFPVRYKQGNADTSLVLDDEWIAAMRAALPKKQSS